ncbi:MAG: hypothetical protein HYR72_20025 [Deltaproteobacteria bacterium]|nr:hypothetical protein [Deltaproteobacteria bacterium]MBI3390834.1 hypothetical protein [Deltaproteobacteria bacterium]
MPYAIRVAGVVRVTGLIATGAALLASIGDLLLLHVAQLGPEDCGIARMACWPELLTGHYLGVLTIPLYGIGYWQVSRGLGANDWRARWVFALGAYASALGGAVHGLTALIIRASPADPNAPGDPFAALAPYAPYLLPLWLLLGVLALAGSALFTLVILTTRTAYPRWFAFANPVVLVALASLATLPAPAIASYVIPAAPNLAHIVFFGASTAVLWQADTR